MKQTKEIFELRESNISVTRQRVEILSCIRRMKCPFTAKDLLKDLVGVNIDRATIYRTLSYFEKKGLVRHAFSIGKARYLIPSGREAAPHAHFRCEKCGRTFCMKTFSPADIKKIRTLAGPGFAVRDVKILFTGTCPECYGSGEDDTEVL